MVECHTFVGAYSEKSQTACNNTSEKVNTFLLARKLKPEHIIHMSSVPVAYGENVELIITLLIDTSKRAGKSTEESKG